ncbi:putative J domain-containing protein C63.13 [Golovinomyces cichoracearum]|uniref:Putative J domain-containing protein C63.13 n=1 Tax=Golovinomyces cichoracearum TaxID=62708 RepID=A0A420IGZ1_9PEZI|nr:putative J domain-containing protein C63.13 [Golovinomyces cichoracearum]
MSTEEPIDFYAALEVDSAATQQQIRDAYKRAALKTHPDRVLPGSPDRVNRTRKFQIVNDAYYTLSDPRRRSEYDSTRRYFDFKSSASTASSSRGGNEKQPPENFPWSSFGFSSKAKTEEEKRRFESEQFGDIFEEMLRDENLSEQNDKPKGWLWSVIGTLSGAAMGFIMANLPGLVTGAVAGNRLGAIRDVKGKSLYEAFQELPAADKTKLLSELATKILSHAVGL